jgi:hypothetical protein
MKWVIWVLDNTIDEGFDHALSDGATSGSENGTK